MSKPRHTDLGLSDEEVLSMYIAMVRTRRLEERIWLLQRQGEVPFCITPAGDEGLHVGYAAVMRLGVDWLHPHYRGWAAQIFLGGPEMLAQIMYSHFGRAASISSAGTQMPSHPSFPELRVVSLSSPVGTQAPQACGTALGSQIAGDDELHFCVFGDGTASQGDIHEAMNFAAVRRLPLIFIGEDNGWAISTPWRLSRPFEDLSRRARGYDMPGVTVDGSDPLEVYAAVKAAVALAQAGEGPSFIVGRVFRFTGHSSADGDGYRDQKEVQAGRIAYDPILRFQEYLLGCGLLVDELAEEIEANVGREVNSAQLQAEKALYPKPEEMLGRVYAPAREVVHA